jgi:hypothetical protein
VSSLGSRIELIDYIDHVAETAGDPKIWLKITSAFRLSRDPGASFALALSLDAAIAMVDKLGFGRLAPVAKARPEVKFLLASGITVRLLFLDRRDGGTACANRAGGLGRIPTP